MATFILTIVTILFLAASVSWLRSGFFYLKHWRNLRTEEKLFQKAQSGNLNGADEDDQAVVNPNISSDQIQLARIEYQKAFHTFLIYIGLTVISITINIFVDSNWKLILLVLALPTIISISWINLNEQEKQYIEKRSDREKRAEVALTQDQLAPRAWAERLAPENLPEFEGLEVAKLYQAGSGLIAGDFYDVFRVSENRLAAVIGDVAGKNIESSITAFQVKYLLRVFLRQFRDPAQALEELNRQLTVHANEDFVSIIVLLFDSEAGVLRYASAGHPIAWLWQDKEIHPMKFTGPVVMLDRESTFYSKEVKVSPGDVVLMYTDGLSEARKSSSEIFGEERVGDMLRRDPTVDVDTMCKQILETAIDYSEGPIIDDMAMIAIRLKTDWAVDSEEVLN